MDKTLRYFWGFSTSSTMKPLSRNAFAFLRMLSMAFASFCFFSSSVITYSNQIVRISKRYSGEE